MKTVQIFCAATWMSFAAGLACSETLAADDAIPQRAVSYADLDLNEAAGVEILYGRIRAAARSVCGATTSQPLTVLAGQECAREALAGAVAKADIPSLTAYHARRSPVVLGSRVAMRP